MQLVPCYTYATGDRMGSLVVTREMLSLLGLWCCKNSELGEDWHGRGEATRTGNTMADEGREMALAMWEKRSSLPETLSTRVTQGEDPEETQVTATTAWETRNTGM